MNGIQENQKLGSVQNVKVHIGTKKKKLTQTEAKRLFNYNRETGVITRAVDSGRYGRFKKGTVPGYEDKNGYVQIRINGRLYSAHRLIWLMEYGYFPEQSIDHINQNTKDNRIENLREVSTSCNLRNRGNPINNTSGVKGVHWYSPANKWKAQIQYNGKARHLGHYCDFSNAVCARLAGEQCINWAGCDTYSPAYQYVQKNIIKKGK